MAGFNDFVTKHKKTIITASFWALFGFSVILGGVLGAAAGGGVLSPLTGLLGAAIFGFLSTALFATIVKSVNKWGPQDSPPEFPDNNPVSDASVGAANVFCLSVGGYMNDGFWNSYNRQLGNLWRETKSWFTRKKPAPASGYSRIEVEQNDHNRNTSRPAYTNQHQPHPESKQTTAMRKKYGVPNMETASAGQEPTAEPKHGRLYNFFHPKCKYKCK